MDTNTEQWQKECAKSAAEYIISDTSRLYTIVRMGLVAGMTYESWLSHVGKALDESVPELDGILEKIHLKRDYFLRALWDRCTKACLC